MTRFNNYFRPKESYLIHTKTERNKQITEMRASGMTFQQIANKLGVSRQKVHWIWKRSNKQEFEMLKIRKQYKYIDKAEHYDI